MAERSSDTSLTCRFARRLALALAPAICLTITPPSARAEEQTTWSRNQCAQLQALAADSPRHGLPAPTKLIERPNEIDRQIEAEFDLDEIAFLNRERAAACDALFVAVARDRAMGRTDPARADRAWHIPMPDYDPAALRDGAVKSANVSPFVEALAPRDPEYRALQDALATLESLPALNKDNRLKRDALIATLERLRWLPRPWPRRYLLVDVAFFDLRLIADGKVLDQWNVIVGAKRTPTPSFVARIEAVTLNPDWTPPREIVRNEILPMLRRDPAQAERLGYYAIDAHGARIIADWRTHPFPYQILQAPGPNNALGAVKLEMPNPYAIYLHDTPNKALFARQKRAMSHGCVRVENARHLAETLLLDGGVDSVGIEAILSAGEKRTASLAMPLPVVILYRTARLGPAGDLQYADDLYGRDQRLVSAITHQREVAQAAIPTRDSECGRLAS